MNLSKKWLVLFLIIVFVCMMFADKIIAFYIDLLWFEKYQLLPVIWTILGAQLGLGLGFGVLFFLISFGVLRSAYNKSSHIPINLKDHLRQNVPILELMATNLKPLVLFVPLFFSVLIGLIAADRWEEALKFLNQVPYGQTDPIFGKDYSFYLFTLPFLTFIKTFLWTGLALIAIGLGLIYFFKQHIFLTASGFGTNAHARKSLCTLAALGFLTYAFDIFLQRFGLLVSSNSNVVAGLNYADAWGRLPLLNFLIILSLIGAVISLLSRGKETLRNLFITGLGIGLVFLASNFYPGLLQKFVVDPNELIKETPYIEHTIAGTVEGYGLKEIEVNELTGSNSIDADTIQKNHTTIENIRLWDQDQLLATLGQIQEIRTYYQFKSVDNDRYHINGKYQQTLLSPRELQSSSLPNRTWINEHLTFTHGYGVSLSPVNQITPEGLPVLYIKDIPPRSSIDLKVTQPEIYYGELSNEHVFVNTGTKEFDYPEGEKNVYKNYEGTGGVSVGSFLRKILFAIRFKTMKILFSQDINSESRVLIYRDIEERVKKVAPFLHFSNDPYLVITNEGRLVWMYDAFTTSDNLPYSLMIRETSIIKGVANYIRNSVKVVIDAYDGSMTFYISDSKDPIIATYKNLFPTMFQELEKMPLDLKQHIRYPSLLFNIQAFVYATYHMKTPQIFYNKEDQWEIPEIDGKGMQPYYTIMKLPGKSQEEYILMLPFTPSGKQNLSAWMVGLSDGVDYGKLLIYKFPKQKLIYGPEQMVARINQDAEISRQISLWDQRGSQVIQGNLLVIPIEESLIYVRPLYLKAENGKIPELKRVIVGYQDQIAMEPTLDEALSKIFRGFEKQTEESSESILKKDEGSKETQITEGFIVLKEADYRKIKDFYERTIDSQDLLKNALSNYQQDLKDLGTALDNVTVLSDIKTAPEPLPNPIEEKKVPSEQH